MMTSDTLSSCRNDFSDEDEEEEEEEEEEGKEEEDEEEVIQETTTKSDGKSQESYIARGINKKKL